MSAKKVKCHCNDCKKETNHSILKEHERHGDAHDGDIQWWGKFQIVECLGCDTVSFRQESTCTEDIDFETGRLNIDETLFPDSRKTRAPIKDSDLFPNTTRRIYKETLKALSDNCRVLAAIGLRTLIESSCKELKLSGVLAKKLDKLSPDYLSNKQVGFLHELRFMGNDAAHETVAPTVEELTTGLELAETLLKTIYILPELSDDIKAAREKSIKKRNTAKSKK